MSKKGLLPSRPRHILVYDEDWEFFETNYGRNGGAKPVGTSVAIRAILHGYVRRLKANASSGLEEQRALVKDVEGENSNG